MMVDYLKKADTDPRAIAELIPLLGLGAAAEVLVSVKVLDAGSGVGNGCRPPCEAGILWALLARDSHVPRAGR